MSRCKAIVINQLGESVRCQIHDVIHDVHSVDGYSWRTGSRWPNAFRQNPLFLTSGGRIVKPGAGECAIEPEDILLMTTEELQNGIKASEFIKRLNAAKRKWNARKWNRGCKIR